LQFEAVPLRRLSRFPRFGAKQFVHAIDVLQGPSNARVVLKDSTRNAAIATALRATPTVRESNRAVGWSRMFHNVTGQYRLLSERENDPIDLAASRPSQGEQRTSNLASPLRSKAGTSAATELPSNVASAYRADHLTTNLVLDGRTPWDEAKADPIVDHGKAAASELG
jgi:hypothetical protein